LRAAEATLFKIHANVIIGISYTEAGLRFSDSKEEEEFADCREIKSLEKVDRSPLEQTLRV
jgi:hypothetical protein